MATTEPQPASAEVTDFDPDRDFSLGVMFEVHKRFQVVSNLADWLECRDQDQPGSLASSIVLACEDLERELDRLEAQVSNRLRELEGLRKVPQAA